ncbi:MAG: hypothetical protein QNK20_16720 [Aureibaculum sp.]|nr:hypothetical protein [Aureibaculum sp.]
MSFIRKDADMEAIKFLNMSIGKRKPIKELTGIRRWWRHFRNKKKLTKIAKELDYESISF